MTSGSQVFLKTFILFLKCFATVCSAMTSMNAHVIPQCGSQLISIEVIFDADQLPDKKFTDWIVVGVSGRPECRLKGNGETKYIIEIAVFNDPCLTEIPARNVFQNKIRIGKNPLIILKEDQSVLVKCVYGLPTVDTMTLPVITSNFNIENNEINNEIEQKFNQDPVPVDELQKWKAVDMDHLKAVDDQKQSKSVSSRSKIVSTATRKPLFLTTTADNKLIESSFVEADPEKPRIPSFSLALLTGIMLLLLLISGFCICYFFLNKVTNSRNNSLVERIEGSTRPIHSKTESKQSGRLFNESDQALSRNNEVSKVGTILSQNNDDLTYFQNRSLPMVSKQNVSKMVVPLKSNLEEFVSKTYALDEYNNLASPTFVHDFEQFEEREVDVSDGTLKKILTSQRSKPENSVGDTAVSSFRSITEFVHSAETTSVFDNQSSKPEQNENENGLRDCVNSIRGFGHKKLTEQEIIRWKNLILQDANIKKQLVAAKSLVEIETIFEQNAYKNIFTASKWHEISTCVHRTLTNSLDLSKSQSELHIFVGNVSTDW